MRKETGFQVNNLTSRFLIYNFFKILLFNIIIFILIKIINIEFKNNFLLIKFCVLSAGF